MKGLTRQLSSQTDSLHWKSPPLLSTDAYTRLACSTTRTNTRWIFAQTHPTSFPPLVRLARALIFPHAASLASSTSPCLRRCVHIAANARCAVACQLRRGVRTCVSDEAAGIGMDSALRHSLVSRPTRAGCVRGLGGEDGVAGPGGRGSIVFAIGVSAVALDAIAPTSHPIEAKAFEPSYHSLQDRSPTHHASDDQRL